MGNQIGGVELVPFPPFADLHPVDIAACVQDKVLRLTGGAHLQGEVVDTSVVHPVVKDSSSGNAARCSGGNGRGGRGGAGAAESSNSSLILGQICGQYVVHVSALLEPRWAE